VFRQHTKQLIQKLTTLRRTENIDVWTQNIISHVLKFYTVRDCISITFQMYFNYNRILIILMAVNNNSCNHTRRNIAACDSLKTANKSGRNTLEIQLQIKSTSQTDDGHYRRPKHVAASLSRLCYKYVYSCVLTT